MSTAPALESVRRTYEAFAKEHFGADGPERDRRGGLPRALWAKAAEAGLLGLCVDKAHGGQGRPVAEAVAAFEGLGRGSTDTGFLYAMASQLFGITMPLQTLASPALRERYLPEVVSGRRKIAHAFTEEGAGSDAFSMEVRAEEAADGYVLRGAKCFLTNAPECDLALVFARTAGGRTPFVLSSFLVDLSWKGVRKGRTFEKLGLRTVEMGELIFEDVHVPRDHLVGRRGTGLQAIAETTSWERGVLLSTALGPMGRAVETCIARSKSRRQFGKPIGSFQQVSARIADMVSRLHLSRLLIYDFAARLDGGVPAQKLLQEAAITKLQVSQAYVQTMMDALQLFGVRGFLLESQVQQDLRDSLAATIYAGTSEVMKNIIAGLSGVPVE